MQLNTKSLWNQGDAGQAFQLGSNATPPQFVDVNRAKISPDLWETWLPSDSKLRLKPATKHLVPFTVKATVPVTSSLSVRMDFPAFWIALHETIIIPHVDTGEGENTTKTRKELAQAGIPNDARFKSTHPFPYYRRYYYNSAQSFVDGVNWLVAALEGGTMWQFTADRYLYELFIPLTEPPTDGLICNYYHAGQPPVFGMFQGNTVDARLFAAV